MTKAKSLRNFLKKFFNVDSTGMSVSAVLDEVTNNYDVFPQAGPLLVDFTANVTAIEGEKPTLSSPSFSVPIKTIFNAYQAGRTVYVHGKVSVTNGTSTVIERFDAPLIPRHDNAGVLLGFWAQSITYVKYVGGPCCFIPSIKPGPVPAGMTDCEIYVI